MPAMDDDRLVRRGLLGAAIAALCCFTPLLAVALGAVGLSALLAYADFVLLPALLLCIAVVALGLYRRRRTRAS